MFLNETLEQVKIDTEGIAKKLDCNGGFETDIHR